MILRAICKTSIQDNVYAFLVGNCGYFLSLFLSSSETLSFTLQHVFYPCLFHREEMVSAIFNINISYCVRGCFAFLILPLPL